MGSVARYLAAITCVVSFATAVYAEVRLQGGGAIFPAPIYQRWIADYSKEHPGVVIDYQGTGSGAGIKGITDKTLDFGGSDAPMTAEETGKAGDVVHIPTVAGAVVLAYNVPGLKAQLKLDGPTIASIYLGKIKQWNDPKIAAMNPGEALPAQAITCTYRTDGSGTNFVFTSYLVTQSESFEAKIGAGKTVNWPVGQGGKGSDGVAQIITTTPGAIGYVELIYAAKNKITSAQLKNKDGQFVTAGPDTVAAAAAGALSQGDKTLAVNIWNQPGANAYPISALTYVLVHKDLGYMKDAAKAKALVDFLGYSLGAQGQKLAPELGYAALPEGLQKKVSETVGGLTFSGAKP